MCDGSTNLKRCSKCGVSKSADAESFYRDRTKQDGLCTVCKTCRYEMVKDWHANGAKKNRYPEGMKPCMKCGKVLEATTENFSPSQKGRHGLFSWCKPCARANAKKRNPRTTPIYPHIPGKKRCSVCGEYKPATRENFNYGARMLSGVASTCKPCATIRYRAYRLANPEKVRAKDHRRRALKLAAPGVHSGEDIKKQFKQQKGLCYWCRKPLISQGEGKYHVDHLIPLSRGGGNGADNIVCACPFCNFSRNNRLPHEWSNRLL